MDEIVGPWELMRDETGKMTSFDPYTLPAGVVYHWDLEKYQFAVDNISLQNGEVVRFAYTMKYDG